MTHLLLSLALAFGGSPTDQTLGFRTDGTGRYPNADPPIHWSPSKNVVWHIPLTQSNAIPVILGEKLFTCAEPCVLLCVNKVDGKILWKGESTYKELPLTDKEKAQYEVEKKRAADLN